MARKEKQYHFIYKTTNLLNGKYYYGMHSTDKLNDGYLGSGKRLRYSINKHGKENHKLEHLEFLPDRKSLINREKEVINLNEIAKEKCMNLMVGGKGGFISEEQQKYRSSCAGKAYGIKLRTNPVFNKMISIKRSKIVKLCWENGMFKNRNHVGFREKKHTEETKKLMSIVKIGMGVGEKNSQYGTCWITNGKENKKIKKNKINDYNNTEWILGRTYNRR